MGLLLAYCGAVVNARRYRLRLTPAGFSFGNLRGRVEYTWEDAQKFGILKAGDDAYVGFVLRPGREAPGDIACDPEDDGEELPTATPENAGTRHAILPFLRIVDATAN
jgi:hypothetical protein